MKLHLPSALRKALLLVLAVVSVTSARAGTLHSQVTLQTYTDFGQNMGRYVTGSRVNALLAAIREKEGITITYTDGRAPYRLEHDQMVSFDGQTSEGAFAAIGYNFLASVQHNGTPNPSFTTQELPANNSVRYTGIEYRSSDKFITTPDTDYKVTRLSKVITDAHTSAVYTGDVPRDTLLYRAGAGVMSVRNTDGSVNVIYDAYAYITGGIVSTDGMGPTGKTGDSRALSVRFNYSESGISDLNPLPFSGDGGDSGSPVWVWNAETSQYEYLIAVQAVNGLNGHGTNTYCKGAPEWSQKTMDSYSKVVDIGAGTNTVYINSVKKEGETVTDSAGRVAEKWSGTVTNVNGDVLTDFQGVKSGINTWMTLTPEIDNDNWYAYGDAYLNAGDAVSETKKLSKATLFYTENLVFNSSAEENNVIIDEGDVDLGVGYAQFSRSEQAVADTVNYSISGGMFNHAGYVVDKGVAVHLTKANTAADYVREWRKVGEGDLYIEGTGNNEIVLNVGGKGSVYLDEKGENAYAAYNVLANTGATVVLQGGVNQIARDFTFGNGGGKLDLYGHSMTWNNSETDVSADGFTIHALTEEAVITNSAATAVTLTISDAGATYMGSFQDCAGAGALNIVYNGTEKWTLNSIATNLRNNAKSSFTVQQGSVELAGTHTKHAMGSIDGRSTRRLELADDWHYADAKMNVTVESGAEFILGSHARLEGMVAVKEGGTFTLREGVTHNMEYVEGGSAKEDTYAYKAYYGLHGNVLLNSGSNFRVDFSADTDADTELAGRILGSGSMTVDSARGSLTLSGNNTDFTGSKELVAGALIAKGLNAAGNVTDNKWHVREKAWFTVEGATGEQILNAVAGNSNGVLALSSNQTQLLNLTGHQNLIIGAQDGHQITYGTANQTLQANTAKQWLLGGGGGELIVEALLNDKDATLVLGNAYTSGTVTLKNTNNKIGFINFEGLVTLKYEDHAALGEASINLTYGNRVMGSEDTMKLLPTTAAGTMLLDKLEGTDINLCESHHASLYLGAAGNTVYTGTITTEDDTYRLGGSTGVLSLQQSLAGNRNLSVDAQHYSGGAIELLSKAQLTGNVTVMGYDSSQTQTTGGDITLRLSAEDALATAASVSLKEGGILDVNGNAQHFKDLSMEAGSALIDSSPDRNASVTVAISANKGTTNLLGKVEVGSLDLTIGQGTTTNLGNAVLANSLTKKGEGTLTLNLTTAFTGDISIESGTVKLNSNQALGAFNTDSNRSIIVHSGATLDYNGKNDNNPAYAVTLDGGTLTNSGASVSSGFRQLITKLTLTRDSYIDTNNNFGLIGANFSITSLDLGGHTLEKKGSGTYHIINADITPGTVKVSGGDISFVDKGVEKASRLGADLEAAGGTMNGSVALSKDITATLSGGNLNLTFNTGGHQLTFDTNLDSALTESTIRGEGTVRKTGTGSLELKKADTLNHVIVDDGTLKLSAGKLSVSGDMTVQKGAMEITSSDFSQEGNINLYRGASLTVQNTALTDGKLLTVTGSDSESATLNSRLALQGGTLVFDSNALNDDTFALKLSGLTVGETVQSQAVSFTHAGSLLRDTDYKLASGQWSSLDALNYYVAEGADYLTANFSAKEDGLYVSFGEKDGYSVWNGTTEAPVWSDSTFGNNGTQPGDDSTVVFNDTASERNVQLQGTPTAKALLFDNTEDYSISAADASTTLNVTAITQRGEGHTTLDKGVVVAEGGTVSLEAGKLTVTDGSVLEHAASIGGEGTLEIALEQSDAHTTLAGTQDLRRLEVNRGTLDTETALNVRELSIGREGTMLSSSATLVTEGTVALAGTMELALQENAALTTKVTAAAEGQKGTIVKSGGGSVSLSSEIEAATLEVQEGGFNADGGNNLVYLLGHVDTLRAAKNASISLGRNAYTVSGDNFTNNFEANGGTLNMAISQHATKTITGQLSVTNGGTLNMADGGLRFTGDITLGASDTDSVTLKGNYGKGGIILDGVVGGQGTVNLVDGGNSGPQKVTLSNDKNTFAGTYKVNSRTQLVLQSELAAKGADINLDGGSLVLETSVAVTKGLIGNGTVAFNGTGEGSGSTLALTGDNCVFEGSIGSGVNLAMRQGSQTMQGNSAAFSGSVAVEGGTLTLKDSEIVNNASAINVAQSGTLHLDGELSLVHTTITNSGNVIYDTSALYHVSTANLQQKGCYELVSGTGTVNASNLTLDDFRINGTDITLEHYSDSVYLEKASNHVRLVVNTDAPGKTVFWTGSKDNTWDLAVTTNWTTKPNEAKALVADNVIFGSEGSSHTQVTIAEGAAVTNATVTDGMRYTFSNSGKLTILDTLTVDAGAEAVFDNLSTAQTTMANGNVTAATANITQGTHTFNGNTTFSGEHATNALVVSGGETAFNGTTEIGNNVVINSGATSFNAKVDVNGDIAVGGQRNAVISIDKGGVLTTNGLSTTSGGFRSLEVEGVLNANKITMKSGSGHTDYIRGSGTINAGAVELGFYSNYTFSDVRLNVGSLTASYQAKPGTITMQDTTIGTLKASLASTVSMVLAGEVTIDTEVYDKTSNTSTGQEGYMDFYSGVISGSGKLVKDGAGVLELEGFNTYTGGTEIRRGILRASKGAALANGDVRIANDGVLQLNYGVSAKDVTLAGGRIEMAPGKTSRSLASRSLTIEGSGSLGKGAGISVQGDGTTGVTISGQEGGSAIYGDATLRQETDGSISLRGEDSHNMTELQNTLIDLAAGTRLEMANVILGINSSTKGEATLVANELTVEADGAALQLQPLTFGDSQTKQVEKPAVIASLTLSNIKDVIIEGAENKGMLVHLAGDYTLGNVDWVKVGLGEGAKFNDGLAVTLLYENEAGQELTVHGQYTMAEVEVQAAAEAAAQNHDYVYFRLTGTVPEPTTGTLSLLALAALAARRRRK